LTDEQIANMLYENPKGAIEAIKQSLKKEYDSALDEKTKPLFQRADQAQRDDDWSTVWADFTQDERYKDYANYHSEIKEYINSRGLGNEKGVENVKNILDTAYHYVKGMKYVPSNPDELLTNEDFITKIMSNEQLTNRIVQAHMEKVNTPAPRLIDNTIPGGSAPMLPPNIPTNKKEAHRSALDRVNRFFSAR
jgi:hypothetical protein